MLPVLYPFSKKISQDPKTKKFIFFLNGMIELLGNYTGFLGNCVLHGNSGFQIWICIEMGMTLNKMGVYKVWLRVLLLRNVQ